MPDRVLLPDVLERFPVGTTIVWINKKWQDRPHYVIGRVLGRSKHQGNGRLSIRVLSIRKTPIGNVLFIMDKPAILTTNVMTLADWWTMRHGGM